MAFTLFILKFFGFYLLYTNSGKTTYTLYPWEQSIRRQRRISLSLGGFLIGITLAGYLFLFGFAGGLFYDLVCLMTLASLLILLRPLLTKEQPKAPSNAGK